MKNKKCLKKCKIVSKPITQPIPRPHTPYIARYIIKKTKGPQKASLNAQNAKNLCLFLLYFTRTGLFLVRTGGPMYTCVPEQSNNNEKYNGKNTKLTNVLLPLYGPYWVFWGGWFDPISCYTRGMGPWDGLCDWF